MPNGESRKEGDVLCETTIVGDASRGEELALVPRSALIGSNTGRLSVSAKIFTLDACVVQMVLATMILCSSLAGHTHFQGEWVWSNSHQCLVSNMPRNSWRVN